MKIEYYVSPHRVPLSHVHLREAPSVRSVLQAALWFPKVLRVHIETTVCCCTSPLLTDPLLARFVALEEGDTFVVHCDICNTVVTTETTDLSRLHWRSSLECTFWRGLPWYDRVMADSVVEGTDGALGGGAGPEVILQRDEAGPEVIQRIANTFKEVIPLIRACVHPRLVPFMKPVAPGAQKIYAAVRLKRDDGYWFLVKQKKQCLAWPRGVVVDRYLVQSAARSLQEFMTLEQVMQSVVQCIPVASNEWMMVLSWPVSLEASTVRGKPYQWVHEVSVSQVHGMTNKLPWFSLALGTTRRIRLHHGTSTSAAAHIVQSGFKSSAFHRCTGTYYKCRPPYACCCKGMLGPGVYLAEFEKARNNAGRVAGAYQVASVLACDVEPGECKFVTPWSMELCKCGCNSLFSDHVASWYHDQLFDSIVLCDGAGVKRREFCVRRPKRVHVREEHFVKFNDQREVILTFK
jgi:hypothetical protein